jgi:hypothetical protein
MLRPPDQTVIPLCRHIRTNGVRCRAAAISGQDFCYFHVRLHKDHPAPLTAQKIVAAYKEEHKEAWRSCDLDPMDIARAYPRQIEFNFPPLEDADSVQLAGSMLFHAIAQGHIHPLRARILIDALRIVNSSMRKGGSSTAAEPADTVLHIEQSETGVTVAPSETTLHPAQPQQNQ